MVLAIVAEPAPLKNTADNVVRVGKTRVTLDTVVAVFKQGTTAEEIVYRYPSLKHADVYGTIAFYLNHQQEVEAYLLQRQQQAQEVRKMNEAKFDPQAYAIDYLLAKFNGKHVEIIEVVMTLLLTPGTGDRRASEKRSLLHRRRSGA